MEECPPTQYRKKVVNRGSSRPLSETYNAKQIAKRISFYAELNRKRDSLKRAQRVMQKRFALYGLDDTTTVRVYMRETVSRIAAELFNSRYELAVSNVYQEGRDGTIDRDHGHVVVTVKATQPEIDALLQYIGEGASYFVYDGEKSKYSAGNTDASEFIIVKPDENLQPKHFWRRSQSFIARIEELEDS